LHNTVFSMLPGLKWNWLGMKEHRLEDNSQSCIQKFKSDFTAPNLSTLKPARLIQ
jgi:hypothetical protein